MRKVEFRTAVMAARLALLAYVEVAKGNANSTVRGAEANAARTRYSVEAEMRAFANVSAELHGRVTPHQVLDYAYWQLVIGDDMLSTRPPLHDILLGSGRARATSGAGRLLGAPGPRRRGIWPRKPSKICPVRRSART